MTIVKWAMMVNSTKKKKKRLVSPHFAMKCASVVINGYVSLGS